MNDDELFNNVLDDGYIVEWTGVTSATHPHPRAWTVGRTLIERPELLISGLDKETSHMLIDSFVEIDGTTPLQVDQQVGRVFIVEAEPAVAVGAVARFPTPSLKVYQLVWTSPMQGLDSDRDQKVYARGSTILNDPYGAL